MIKLRKNSSEQIAFKSKLQNLSITMGLLLIAQFIFILFQCQFNLQDVLYYTQNYWHNYIFNIILLYFFYLAFLVIFNRKTYASFLLLGTTLLFSMANFLKISYRNEPVLPSDFSMIHQLNHIILMINKVHMISSVAVILFLIAAFFFLKIFKSKPIFTIQQRLLLSFILFFVFYSFFNSNHSNNPYKIIATSFGITNIYWDLKEDYSSNGPLAGFIKNLDIQVMEEVPANYSYEAVSEIVEKYKGKSTEINYDKETLEDQTVIFILSESFMDPLRIPGLELSDDPMPFIRSLKNETTSGLILGSSYGGGTANVEYEVLTAFSTNYFHSSLLIPYTLLVPNLHEVPNVTNIFNKKIAVHAFNANLYRRKEVFEKFGFDPFIYEGSNVDLTYKDKLDNSNYISDESAYQEVLDIVENDEEGGLFILLTTMQNHGPYEKDKYDNQFQVLNDLKEREKTRIETYIQGVHYTDLATEKFIEQIDAMDRPITVVFFGDHMPSEVFEGFDDGNDETNLAFYETDYFIYSNFETETLDYPIVSPNMISSIALEQVNATLTPYYALMYELQKTVPVIRWGEYYLSEEEIHVYEDELPTYVHELINDFRMIQYDITAGEQYSVELGMFDFGS
ncbi:LTA synthase family protein [Solibacillus sp. CAU 1738]|uniref:LTA synthase family protein n=1 Tax=Solibacillus sp. CAU 1738 TaxID=3140363 RepID=UPI003261639C